MAWHSAPVTALIEIPSNLVIRVVSAGSEGMLCMARGARRGPRVRGRRRGRAPPCAQWTMSPSRGEPMRDRVLVAHEAGVRDATYAPSVQVRGAWRGGWQRESRGADAGDNWVPWEGRGHGWQG